MYKNTILIVCAMFACAAAKPAILAAYTSPAVFAAAPAAPYITATSSQVISRNHNGIVAAAPYVAVAAPFTSAAAYTASPYFGRYTAPLSYANSRIIASPYVGASSAYTSAISPFGYVSPYQYAAAVSPYVI